MSDFFVVEIKVIYFYASPSRESHDRDVDRELQILIQVVDQVNIVYVAIEAKLMEEGIQSLRSLPDEVNEIVLDLLLLADIVVAI